MGMKRYLALWGLFATFCAMPAPLFYGDWSADIGDDGTFTYAATANDSGGAFGEYCYFKSGNCMWILGMSTGCESGKTYPVLASSEAGAEALEVRCDGELLKGKYRYTLTDFDAMSNIVHQAKGEGMLAFAFPMPGSTFRVSRFPLAGSGPAIAAIEGYLAKHKASPTTKDQDI